MNNGESLEINCTVMRIPETLIPVILFHGEQIGDPALLMYAHEKNVPYGADIFGRGYDPREFVLFKQGFEVTAALSEQYSEQRAVIEWGRGARRRLESLVGSEMKIRVYAYHFP